MAIGADLIEYIVIFGFFYFFLNALIRLANQDIEKPRKPPKQDDFYKAYSYAYDYVMVFHVYEEGEKKDIKKYMEKFSMRNIIDRITIAGMETSCFYSCQKDEVYMKIRASPSRLKAEADRINYKLALVKEKVRNRLQTGARDRSWKPVTLLLDKKLSSLDPFEYLYGKYSAAPEHESLYKRYKVGIKEHIFRGVDRIKLIISIMEAPQNLHPPGCGLNLRDLMHQKAVLASFPIHDYDELKRLQKKWLTIGTPPWKQPIDDVKDYFGEKIGLYFLFLQHYVTLLMWPAFLGLITFIVKSVYDEPENFLMPYFAVFTVVWSSFFMEFWKRRQSTASLKWGSSGFEEEEQDRPQFKGEQINSYIDGQPMTYFSSAENNRRVTIVNTIISLCVLGVVITVAGVFYLQYFMSLPANQATFTVQGTNLASIVTSLLSTIVITTLNIAYGGTAVNLNEYENHRTDTDYEDNLIAKIFIFQLVNSFAALTYVSFIKSFLGLNCIRNNCIYDASATLSTIFIIRLVTQLITEVFVRRILQYMKEKKESSGLEPGVVPSPIEQQYVLSEYDVVKGPLMDFAALVIQYGFTVLFVAAFPLSPTLACVSSYIIIRINGWKLCQAFRRPQPKTAEDIGVWQDMLEILSALCTIYNFGLIFFTSHYLQDITWEYRWVMFIGAEHGMFILKFAIAAVVDDVPHEVDLQLQRQDFIVSKVIEGEPDEINEDFKPPDEKSNVIIGDTDYDWETDNGDDSEDEEDEEEEKEEEGGGGGGAGGGGGKDEDDED